MRRTARIAQRTAVLLTIVLLTGCTPVDGGTTPTASQGTSGGDSTGDADEPSACGADAIAVGADAADLQRALDAARPGDALQLADTTYTGTFTISVSGDAAHPITLCGARGTRLDGGTLERGYVLHLDGASHWVLDGFAVTRGAKGIVLDRSSDALLRNLDVSGIGQEGIHLRTASSRNTITATTVRDTGLTDPTFGEGVYVGSAQSNWCTYTACEPDASDDNTIEDSTIEGTRAEAIDVKEGTTGTLIRHNTLGIASDAAVDSVVDLKGNDALFDGNHVRTEGITGIQVHVILPGWGARNIITGNTFAPGDGDTPPAIELAGAARAAGNVVSCSNVTASGTTVTTNVTCAG